ncbi:MAG: serine/threonine-protein phosphatase [Desulfosarcina sp.]|nr:serine/threonine-protein phosphatase [Desulfobacterales bacterium]
MEYIKFNQKTAAGYVRFRNEDSHAVVYATDRSGALADVCRGMGGAIGGEIASKIACETFYAYPRFEDGNRRTSLLRNQRRLKRLIHLANENICDFATAHPRYHGMGTTVSALLFLEDQAVIAHVGDSRVYRLRDGKLALLTRDQTLLDFLIRSGRLNSEQAFGHPSGNVLMQAVGLKSRLEHIYTRTDAYQSGDLYILCSDGLSDYITEADLQAFVIRGHVETLCDRLVAEALRRGGQDNVTVITAFVQASSEDRRAA